MSFGDRDPAGRLHFPRYRENACYYGRDERCPLCWGRLFWFVLPGWARALVGVSLVFGLAVVTLFGLWLVFGGWL